MTWAELLNLTEQPDASLAKTGGTSSFADGTAVSADEFDPTDITQISWVQSDVNFTKDVRIGFEAVDGSHYFAWQFAYFFEIVPWRGFFEDGVNVGPSFLSYSIGDSYDITLDDGTLKYWHNGIVWRTISIPTGVNYRVRVEIKRLGAGAPAIAFQGEIVVPPAVPIVPSYPVQFEIRKKVLLSQTETLVRQTVTKSKAFFYYPLAFNGRKSSEYDDLQDLWESLFPDQPFEWNMPHLNASGLYLMDSPVRLVRSFHQRNDFSVTIRSMDPLTVVAPGTNTLPFSPDYDTETSPFKQVSVSDSVANARAAKARSGQKLPLNLVFRNRYLSDLQSLIHFWAHHYPRHPIEYTDPWTNVTADYWIDSDLRGQFTGFNRVDCTFAVREV